jgi:uncharacterized protein with GYD domain
MLFCLTAEYTSQALNAMRENPASTSRQEAVANLLEAAGGKLVAMYFRVHNGPGAMAVFDVPDPVTAPAITSIAVQSNALQNVKIERLYTQDEVMGIREKVRQLRGSYKAPGQ